MSHIPSKRLPIKNFPVIRQKFREYISSGVLRKDLMVFRCHDGTAQVFLVDHFCHNYHKMYPDLCAELQRRRERLEGFEIQYVWALPDGSYDAGVLMNKRSLQTKIISS